MELLWLSLYQPTEMEWETYYQNLLQNCPLKLKGELSEFRVRQKGQKK